MVTPMSGDIHWMKTQKSQGLELIRCQYRSPLNCAPNLAGTRERFASLFAWLRRYICDTGLAPLDWLCHSDAPFSLICFDPSRDFRLAGGSIMLFQLSSVVPLTISR